MENYENHYIFPEISNQSRKSTNIVLRAAKRVWRWANATRLRKILSSTLALLILLTSIRYIFLDPKEVKAADTFLKLDEGYGTTTSDANSAVSALTITGATWRTDDMCFDGKCLYFDGGDQVLVADASTGGNLDFTHSESFTVSVWVRHSGSFNGNSEDIVSKINPDDTDGGWRLQFEASGVVSFKLDDDDADTAMDDTVQTTSTYGDSRWHHIEVVKNANTSITIYVDGNEAATGTPTVATTLANDDAFTLGLRDDTSSPNTHYTGFIDEVKVYRSARSAAEVKADFLSSTRSRGTSVSFGPDQSYLSEGLVGYWNLNENTGTSATDSSGTGNTQTLSSSSWSTGKFGSGWNGDGGKWITQGSDDNDFDFTLTEDFSYSLWFKSDSTTNPTNNEFLIDKENASAGYGIYFSTNGFATFGIDDDSSFTPDDSAQYGTDIYDATWHHLVAVKRGSQKIDLYIDGVLQTSTPITITGTLANSDFLTIGAQDNAAANDEFTGDIDDVRVYRAALSDIDIKSLYNWAPGPVGYWNFDENTGTVTAYDKSGNANDGSLSTGGGGESGADSIVDLEEGDTSDFSSVTDPDSDITVNGTAASAGTSFGMAVVYDDTALAYGSETISVASATDIRYRFYFDTTALTPGTGNVFSISTLVSGTTVRYRINIIENSGSYNIRQIAFNDAGSNTSGAANALTNGEHYVEAWITKATNSTSTDAVFRFYLDGSLVDTISGIDLFDDFATLSAIRLGIAGVPDAGTTGSIYVDELVFRDDTTEIGAHGTGATPEWVNGKFGSALQFDGSSSSIDAGSGTTIDELPAHGMSISAWIYPKSMGESSAGFIAAKNTNESQNNGWYLRLSGTNAVTFSVDGTGDMTHQTSNNVITLNSWNHVMVVWDGVITTAASAKIYINGAESTYQTTTNGSSRTSDAASNFWIGNSSNDLRAFDGTIDEVKYYNYQRTAAQIVEDMNGGHPSPGSPVGSAIGHWKFDQGVDGTCSGGTNDACNTGSSGSTLDGAQSGMAVPSTSTSGWTTEGKFGKALSFDGTNDYIEVADSSTVDITGDFTLSAWVLRAGGTNAYIITKFGASGGGGYALLHGASGEFYCRTDNGTTLTDSFTPTGLLNADSTWHHLVAVRSGSSCRVYFDGIDRTSTVGTHTTLTANALPLRFGVSSAVTPADYLQGKIDDPRVFNTALTADQVKVLYNQGAAAVMGSTSTDSSGNETWSSTNEYCPPGLGSTCTPPVGEWKFDENTGTTAYDSAGKGNNATLTDGPTYTQGKIGQAINFDGSNDVVRDSSVTTDIQILGNTTVSLWFNARSWGDGEIISTMRGSGEIETDNEMYLLELDTVSGNDLLYQHENGAGVNNTFTIDANLSLNTWYHVLMTRDVSTNTVDFYINGRYISTYSYTNDPTGGSTSDFRVGGNVTTDYFDGIIDNVHIYNYKFTQPQIAWNYNNGKAISWWKTDEASWNGTAGEVKDSSGNLSNGVRIGNATTTTSGKYNSAGTFDGTGDAVSVADPSTGLLDFGTNVDFSVSSWVKTSTATADQIIVMKGMEESAPVDGGWFLGFENDTDKLRFHITADNWNNYCSIEGSTNIADGQWHHVAVGITRAASCTTSQVQIYVDGKPETQTLIFSGNNTNTSVSNNDQLTIGSFYALSTYSSGWNGQIDDLRIFSYKLTNKQVELLYNENAALRFGPATGTP